MLLGVPIVKYGTVTKTYCNKLEVVLAVRGKLTALGMLVTHLKQSIGQVRY